MLERFLKLFSDDPKERASAPMSVHFMGRIKKEHESIILKLLDSPNKEFKLKTDLDADVYIIREKEEIFVLAMEVQDVPAFGKGIIVHSFFDNLTEEKAQDLVGMYSR